MVASINNYQIGKGIATFAARDLGNCPEFEFTPEIDKLEHFSSREGVRTKDLTVVLEKKGTLRIVLEEFSAANLALAVLDDTYSSGAIEIFGGNAVSGAVTFTGTNEVGPKYLWTFLKVDFVPSSGISLISDEWGQIEINGDVAAVGGSFGTITAIAGSA
jgi:hypothetical protein